MFWWFAFPSAEEIKGWSWEEKSVRARILVMGFTLAIALGVKFKPVMDQFGRLTEYAITGAGLLLCACVGRLLCRLFWPDLVRAADKKAARRVTGFGTE